MHTLRFGIGVALQDASCIFQCGSAEAQTRPVLGLGLRLPPCWWFLIPLSSGIESALASKNLCLAKRKFQYFPKRHSISGFLSLYMNYNGQILSDCLTWYNKVWSHQENVGVFQGVLNPLISYLSLLYQYIIFLVVIQASAPRVLPCGFSYWLHTRWWRWNRRHSP